MAVCLVQTDLYVQELLVLVLLYIYICLLLEEVLQELQTSRDKGQHFFISSVSPGEAEEVLYTVFLASSRRVHMTEVEETLPCFVFSSPVRA